jgi:protein-tyrosine phosphatase
VSGYVDLHSHVLPGIDDGAPDLDESLAMLRAAAASGVTTVAATPHLGADFPNVRVGELANRCAELRDAAGREGIEIRLVSGAEVSLVWALEASDEELRLATYEQRGSDLLIETPSVKVVGLDRLLYELRIRGARITLAHPERSQEVQREPARLEGLVREGILLQLDADTLLGDSRRSAGCRLGRRLCLEGLVHAVASDGHRASSWRAITRLARARQAATALVGEPRAQWMTVAAPAAIIAGTELPDPPAVVPERRRRWLLRRPRA